MRGSTSLSFRGGLGGSLQLKPLATTSNTTVPRMSVARQRLGVLELGVDEVDEDLIQQAADLDDGHVVDSIAGGGRAGGSGASQRPQGRRGYEDQTGPQ